MANTINKQSSVTPELSDLIPIWQSSNNDTRRTSLNYLLELFQNNLVLEDTITTQYYSPNTTGYSVEVTDSGENIHLLLTPTTGVATGEIILPEAVVDKQTVLVTTTQAVTTTLTVTSTKTVNGAPTTLTANDFFTLKYDATFDSWYRVG